MGRKEVAKLASKSIDKKDVLDRLRDHIFSGGTKKLSEKDNDTLIKLRRINQALVSGYGNTQVVKIIETEFSLGQAQAYNLINQSIKLYGDIQEGDKQGSKVIMKEMYLRAAKKALEMGDMANHLHALDSISKLDKLFDATQVNIDMSNIQLPKAVIISGDLKVLEENMRNQPLDITDFEEVSE
jgi:hypothetical protein